MKFSIRDFLWLILVLAIAFSRYANERKWSAQLREAEQRHTAHMDKMRDESAKLLAAYRAAALDPLAYQKKVADNNRAIIEARKAEFDEAIKRLNDSD